MGGYHYLGQRYLGDDQEVMRALIVILYALGAAMYAYGSFNATHSPQIKWHFAFSLLAVIGFALFMVAALGTIVLGFMHLAD